MNQENVFSNIENNGPFKDFGIALKDKGLGTEDIIYYELEGDTHITGQAKVAGKIAGGDLSLEIISRSDQDVLAHSMMSVVRTLNELAKEAEGLTAAAVEGRLEKRGDADRFEGGFKQIISGFNQTLDGIVNPLNVKKSPTETI